MIPPFVFSSASTRFTRIRSLSGLIDTSVFAGTSVRSFPSAPLWARVSTCAPQRAAPRAVAAPGSVSLVVHHFVFGVLGLLTAGRCAAGSRAARPGARAGRLRARLAARRLVDLFAHLRHRLPEPLARGADRGDVARL